MDIQDRLVKPEKIPRIEKVPKVEKPTSKNEKKTTKVAEKVDTNEIQPVNINVNMDPASKKSNDAKKERESTTGKKKSSKQKETKKKNGNVKKKYVNVQFFCGIYFVFLPHIQP